jgi:hypothetical protein
MRIGLRTALSAFLVACSAISFAQGGAADATGALPEVARALLDEARQASGVGDWERAAVCLDEAVIQDSGDSDILYLRALASVKLSKPFASALGDLDAALGTDRFQSYSRRDASVFKAELLVRERRWKEALDALGSPAGENAADPAYALIRAKALAGSGDVRGFTREMSESLRRFPGDVSFARLFIARAGKLPASDAFRSLGDTILGRLQSYAAADPELLVLSAPLMPDLSSRRDAVLAYRASGGKSSKSTLRALEYGIIDETAASAELLSGQSPVALEDLSSLMALAGSPAGRAAVLSSLASWSGTVLVDADSDGIYEESFELDKGLVRAWSRDSRQAGIVDERADFADGLPREILLSRADLEIRIRYSVYPSVSTVSYVRKDGKSTYAFGPEGFAFAALDMRPFAGSGRDSIYFPRVIGAIDPSERASAATALSVETVTEKKREIVALDRGLPVEAVTYVGDRIFSKRSYEKGRPVLERVDADGDGRFEIEKGFVPNGALNPDGTWPLAWIRIDADGDGVFEYREQTVFPFRKEWDYDGNGSVDAIREQLADGSIRESYSSRLNGRMDEELIIKDGKITSIKRDGIRLGLIPDGNRQLTWIGKKRFDLGSDIPDGEGIFSHMGKRYRLTRIGALAFAELVP